MSTFSLDDEPVDTPTSRDATVLAPDTDPKSDQAGEASSQTAGAADQNGAADPAFNGVESGSGTENDAALPSDAAAQSHGRLEDALADPTEGIEADPSFEQGVGANGDEGAEGSTGLTRDQVDEAENGHHPDLLEQQQHHLGLPVESSVGTRLEDALSDLGTSGLSHPTSNQESPADTDDEESADHRTDLHTVDSPTRRHRADSSDPDPAGTSRAESPAFADGDADAAERHRSDTTDSAARSVDSDGDGDGDAGERGARRDTASSAASRSDSDTAPEQPTRKSVAFSPDDLNAELPPLPPRGELGGAAHGMRPRSMQLDDGVAPGWKEQIGLPENAIRLGMWGPKGEKSSFEIKLDETFTIAAVREGILKVAPGMPREHLESLDFFEISGQGVPRQLADSDDPREVRRNKSELVVMPPEQRPVTLYFQNLQGTLGRDFVVVPLKWTTTAKQLCNPGFKGHSKGFKQRLRDVAPPDAPPEAAPALFLRKNFRDMMFADDDCPLDVFYEPAVDGAPRERILHSSATKLLIKSKQLRTDIDRRESVAAEYDETAPLQGYLHKKGDDARAAWKRRWFIFKEDVLYYYREQTDRDPISSINASAFVRCYRTDRPERPFHFVLDTNLARGDFHLAAESNAAAYRWVDGLNAAAVEPTIAGLLQKKGEQGGGWKSRYFELRGRHLVYFESKDKGGSNNRQKGTIVLDADAYVEPSIDEETRFSVVTTSSKRKTGVYELRAASTVEAQDWIDQIRRAIKGEAPLPKQDDFGDAPAPTFSDGDGDDFAAQDVGGAGGAFGAGGGGSNGRHGRSTIDEDLRMRMNRSNSTVFSRPERFAMPTGKPTPLGAPLFDPREAPPETAYQIDYDDSKPNPYANVSNEEWGRRHDDVAIDPSLEAVMGRDDALNSLGFAPPAAMVDLKAPVHDQGRVDNLERNAKAGTAAAGGGGGDGGGGKGKQRPLPSGLLSALASQPKGPDVGESAPEPSIGDDFLDILSPAMLRTFVLGEADSEFVDQGHAKIALSGVRLTKHPNGAWAVARGGGGQRGHGPLPATLRETHTIQSFRLKGGVEAHFVVEEERWHVAAPAETPAPQRPSQAAPLVVDPVVKEWLRLGGARPIALAEAAVETILAMYNEPLAVVQNGMRGVKQPATVTAEMQAAVTKTRRLVLDDSRNERVGIVVRKDVCGALADALRSGMRQSRLFSKTTLWTLVNDASPKPTANSEPYQFTAYKVVRDLERNPNMVGDNDIKFRSFICAGLNHHFLCAWLEGLYRNEAVIKRHYVDFAFMHVCPEPIFERLVMALEPLMALPFRLFTSFEQRRRSVHGKGGTSSAAAAAASRNRAGSTQSAAPGRQARDLPRSASIYVEDPVTRPRSASFFVEGESKADPTQPPAAGGGGGDGGRGVPSQAPLAQALYDNLSPDEGELQFRQGEVLEVLQQVDENWLLCEIDGRQGQVPMNYVNILA